MATVTSESASVDTSGTADGVQLHPSFNFISPVPERGVMVVHVDRSGPDEGQMRAPGLGRRHHFGSYLHRGLSVHSFKEGRLQRVESIFLLLNMVGPLICFNQGNAAGIKPCHFQGWVITDL